jgi:hypothetical protein
MTSKALFPQGEDIGAVDDAARPWEVAGIGEPAATITRWRGRTASVLRIGGWRGRAVAVPTLLASPPSTPSNISIVHWRGQRGTHRLHPWWFTEEAEMPQEDGQPAAKLDRGEPPKKTSAAPHNRKSDD